jgi:Mn2+/Fe2+ NRAMP family transporter
MNQNERADTVGLTPPRGPLAMLAAIGPGIVVLGSVIGSGELINTPVQAAKFGFVLVWAVVLSCLVKYFLQVEVGRHCLVHNRSTFEALNHCPGPRIRGTSWFGLLYMVSYTISLSSVVGMLTSVADLFQTALARPMFGQIMLPRNLLGILSALAVAGMLWSGAYGRLEKLVAALVAGFGGAAVLAICLLQRTPDQITGPELASGLTFSLGPHPAAAAVAVISLMGALGTTANELFMYPYWILEKGYGRYTGPNGSPGWRQRTRGWIRVLQLDAAVGTLLAAVVTVAFFLLGAATFHRHGRVPEGMSVVTEIGSVFVESFGGWSLGIFYCAAFCTLFSTLVVAIAATGRMWADMLTSMRLLDRDNPRSRARFQWACQTLHLVMATALMVFLQREPASLVIFGQYVAGIFNTPLLMLAIVWMAFHTDRELRMSRASAVLLVLTTAAIAVCLLVGLLIQSGWWPSA